MKFVKALPKMLRLGLLEQNPLFFCFAFLCPALAASSSVSTSVRLGLTITFVLTLSGACTAALSRIVGAQWRFACTVVVSAFFVSLTDLLLRAYSPEFSVSMGYFIPLLAVGCITLFLSGFGSESGVLASAVQGLFMGLGAVLALFIAGALRAVLVSGAVGDWVVFGNKYPGLAFFATPAGAFIVLGITAGLLRGISEIRLPKRKKAAMVHASTPETTPAKDKVSDGADAFDDTFDKSGENPDSKGDVI